MFPHRETTIFFLSNNDSNLRQFSQFNLPNLRNYSMKYCMSWCEYLEYYSK